MNDRPKFSLHPPTSHELLLTLNPNPSLNLNLHFREIRITIMIMIESTDCGHLATT